MQASWNGGSKRCIVRIYEPHMSLVVLLLESESRPCPQVDLQEFNGPLIGESQS